MVVPAAFGPVADVLVATGLVVVVVLAAFAPVVLVVLPALPDAVFDFEVVVVLPTAFAFEVVTAELVAVAAPAFTVVVVVDLAPFGGGTLQVRRDEPS